MNDNDDANNTDCKSVVPLPVRVDRYQPAPVSDMLPETASVTPLQQPPRPEAADVFRRLMSEGTDALIRVRSDQHRQQCLAFLDALRRCLRAGPEAGSAHSAADTLEELACRLAIIGRSLSDSSQREALKLAEKTAVTWAAAAAWNPTRDGEEVAQRVYRLLRNEIAARVLVPAVTAVLGDAGLRELQELLRNDKFGAPPDEALLQVAAALNDVDAMAEAIIMIDDPDAWAIDVAERLLRANRPHEVLDWLRGTNVPRHERERKTDLRIAAYQLLGRHGAAQRVRWRWFSKTLSRRHFDDYLNLIFPKDRREVCRNAIAVAASHPDVHAAIFFLHGIGERQVAVQLCRDHLHELAAGHPDTILQLVGMLAVDDKHLSMRLGRLAVGAAASKKVTESSKKKR